MSYIYWIHKKEHTDYFTEGYIGVSNNPEKRFMEHKYQTRKENPLNPILSRAMKKNETFQNIILEGTDEYCYEVEAKLRPFDHIGWNIAPGGFKPPSNEGILHTEETKIKMSIASKGKPKSKEHIEKNRQAKLGNKNMLGKHHSQEAKDKISNANKGRFIGKFVSEETKEKIRQSSIGKKASSKARENLRLSHLGKKLSEESIRKREETKRLKRELLKNDK